MSKMLFSESAAPSHPLRVALEEAYREDENKVVSRLVEAAKLDPALLSRVGERARKLIVTIRENQSKTSSLDSLLVEYDLSNAEGIALMCLAEALLRIPDKATIDRLIRDKLTTADWEAHLHRSPSFMVNTATWALMLTGKVLGDQDLKADEGVVKETLKRLLSRSGEPVIRKAVAHAMKIMSRQFVMGQTIEEALTRAKPKEKIGFRFSYDMLGEAARTSEDAARYFIAYQNAIKAVGEFAAHRGPIEGPGVSIKLSALHPRYEEAKAARVHDELIPKVFALARLAKEYDIGLTIDAEEAHRLELSLDVIEKVFLDPGLEGWNGFGLALQSYQKRAFVLIDWLAELALRAKRRLNVRLIKGAYWDSEIKRAQVLGLDGYPVFTRKQNTDVSFIACAKKLLQYPQQFYCQFATHNALSVSIIRELAGPDTQYEFQCLHGMGSALYNQIVGEKNWNIPARVYAPVGSHVDLLPYLVRRLLENGANTSFVNRLKDNDAPVETLIADPVHYVSQLQNKAHPKIPLPRHIFPSGRLNSKGLDLSDRKVLAELAEDLQRAQAQSWSVAPIINGHEHFTEGYRITSPANHHQEVGGVQYAQLSDVESAFNAALNGLSAWQTKSVDDRAKILERYADLLEQHLSELMALAILEAGKTVPDALAEVREAVDFCRYYAEQAREVTQDKIFIGYTGESNRLTLQGRGVIVCISPWNFPLAIFTGQIVAALVMGNAVIAKPAEQTSLIAGLAIRLALAAGIPSDVLHLLPGKGEDIGAALVAHPKVAGVIFTGSTEVARLINVTLAKKPGPIVPFIAETGGQNAMIVDSSALPEQVVEDIMQSAFGSAGQRCSAARVMYLQNDIADKVLMMLKGAMAELSVGDPALLSTDIGPVIDAAAKENLEKHAAFLEEHGKLIFSYPLSKRHGAGTFIPPSAYEIHGIQLLEREVFGPILHIIRYEAKDLDSVIDNINATGYGLTHGIHSRISKTIDHITSRIHAGNCYVNRNMIGAVVGLQPFGGEGLSGTGPKAGGPHYLLRLAVERTLTVNTTAAGGNASLLAMG